MDKIAELVVGFILGVFFVGIILQNNLIVYIVASLFAGIVLGTLWMIYRTHP